MSVNNVNSVNNVGYVPKYSRIKKPLLISSSQQNYINSFSGKEKSSETHEVTGTEWLSHIAKDKLGDARLWGAIYLYNVCFLKTHQPFNPNKISKGMKFAIPPKGFIDHLKKFNPENPQIQLKTKRESIFIDKVSVPNKVENAKTQQTGIAEKPLQDNVPVIPDVSDALTMKSAMPPIDKSLEYRPPQLPFIEDTDIYGKINRSKVDELLSNRRCPKGFITGQEHDYDDLVSSGFRSDFKLNNNEYIYFLSGLLANRGRLGITTKRMYSLVLELADAYAAVRRFDECGALLEYINKTASREETSLELNYKVAPLLPEDAGAILDDYLLNISGEWKNNQTILNIQRDVLTRQARLYKAQAFDRLSAGQPAEDLLDAYKQIRAKLIDVNKLIWGGPATEKEEEKVLFHSQGTILDIAVYNSDTVYVADDAKDYIAYLSKFDSKLENFFSSEDRFNAFNNIIEIYLKAGDYEAAEKVLMWLKDKENKTEHPALKGLNNWRQKIWANNFLNNSLLMIKLDNLQAKICMQKGEFIKASEELQKAIDRISILRDKNTSRNKGNVYEYHNAFINQLESELRIGLADALRADGSSHGATASLNEVLYVFSGETLFSEVTGKDNKKQTILPLTDPVLQAQAWQTLAQSLIPMGYAEDAVIIIDAVLEGDLSRLDNLGKELRGKIISAIVLAAPQGSNDLNEKEEKLLSHISPETREGLTTTIEMLRYSPRFREQLLLIKAEALKQGSDHAKQDAVTIYQQILDTNPYSADAALSIMETVLGKDLINEGPMARVFIRLLNEVILPHRGLLRDLETALYALTKQLDSVQISKIKAEAKLTEAIAGKNETRRVELEKVIDRYKSEIEQINNRFNDLTAYTEELRSCIDVASQKQIQSIIAAEAKGEAQDPLKKLASLAQQCVAALSSQMGSGRILRLDRAITLANSRSRVERDLAPIMSDEKFSDIAERKLSEMKAIADGKTNAVSKQSNLYPYRAHLNTPQVKADYLMAAAQTIFNLEKEPQKKLKELLLYKRGGRTQSRIDWLKEQGFELKAQQAYLLLAEAELLPGGTTKKAEEYVALAEGTVSSQITDKEAQYQIWFLKARISSANGDLKSAREQFWNILNEMPDRFENLLYKMRFTAPGLAGAKIADVRAPEKLLQNNMEVLGQNQVYKHDQYLQIDKDGFLKVDRKIQGGGLSAPMLSRKKALDIIEKYSNKQSLFLQIGSYKDVLEAMVPHDAAGGNVIRDAMEFCVSLGVLSPETTNRYQGLKAEDGFARLFRISIFGEDIRQALNLTRIKMLQQKAGVKAQEYQTHTNGEQIFNKLDYERAVNWFTKEIDFQDDIREAGGNWEKALETIIAGHSLQQSVSPASGLKDVQQLIKKTSQFSVVFDNLIKKDRLEPVLYAVNFDKQSIDQQKNVLITKDTAGKLDIAPESKAFDKGMPEKLYGRQADNFVEP
ncbi:MAG: hypothetical protein ABIH39_01935, partial [Candidatus Margulisiibacteriota bacterium]